MNDARSFFDATFANHIRTGAAVPAGRIFSLGQTKSGRAWGMTWYKARSDADVHLRGLVCFVKDMFWLGWEDDRNTDYASFNARKTADQHTRYFEPTQDDFDRLALEDAWIATTESEHATVKWVVNAVLDAWTLGTGVSRPHPDRPVTLNAEASSEDDVLGDVYLTFELDNPADLDRTYAIAANALPGIEARDWEPDFQQLPRSFALYTMVEVEFLNRLDALRADHGIGALIGSPEMVADPSDGRCHVVRSTDATRGYIEGALIKSVCGRRFVPTEDPDDKDVCVVCAGVVHALGIARDQS